MTGQEDLQGQLTEAQRTIKVLRQELTETNRDVMALTIHLEDRVKERTVELQEANRRLKAEIAERIQVERALRESENRYAAIAENLPNGMVQVFDQDLCCAFSAGEQLQELGWSRESLAGKNIYDVLPEESADVVASKLFRAFDGQSVSFEGEYADHAWLVNAVPLNRSDGDIEEILVLSIDITRRKQAEKELERYSERLEDMVEKRTQDLRDAQEKIVRQEKLATLGRLAGSVSHELRNPLGAIKNAAYFLTLAVQDPDPDVQESLEILEQEVDRSEGVIKGLLDFARSEPPTRQDVSLNQILKETLERLEVSPDVEVIARLDERMPEIRGDHDQLAQVFLNIAQNGVQAMTDGGRLVVESRLASANEVEVSMSDTGAGIPEREQDQIFEPLFTTKTKGIGLGLAIVKTLVEGHGGWIDVESEVGEGSTFTVHLPIEAGPALEKGRGIG